MRRIFGFVTVLLGVLALTAASLVHWVLVPRLAQLPSDTNVTRIYTGSASVVANPTIVTGVRIGPGLLRDVPVEVQHHTAVIGTRGHQALVLDRRLLTIPGYTLATLTNRFDVDRRTFQPGHAFPSATPAQGLTFNWPMDTRPRDYTGWVSDTGRTTQLRFVKPVRRAGVDTYLFQTTTSFAPITDPQVLRVLPSSMTKRQLMEITPSLLFTQQHLLKLSEILAKAPREVPLAYDYKVDATFWVAPDSGIVVDHSQREVRMLSLVVNGKHVPVAPVMDMAYGFTPATVNAAAADAKNSAAQLKLLRAVLPDSLALAGFVLVLIGCGLLLRRTTPPPLGDGELTEPLSARDGRVPTRIG